MAMNFHLTTSLAAVASLMPLCKVCQCVWIVGVSRGGVNASRSCPRGRDHAPRESLLHVSPLGIRWLTLPVLEVKQASPSTTGLRPGWPGCELGTLAKIGHG
eukprot:1948826-Rhodomonas_salina.1